MIYSDELLKELNDVFKERRKKAEAKSTTLADMLENDENYSKALKKYKSAKFDLSKARYEKDGDKEKRAIRNITNAELEMKKAQSELNVTDSDFTPDYTCKKCNDTGFYNGKRCSCFKKAAIELTLKELGMTKKNFPVFAEAANTNANGLNEIYKKFSSYCQHFPQKAKNVVISGNVGSGKSHLAQAVAKKLIDNNFNVVFLSACELNTVFLRYHTSPVYERSFYLSLLTGCDLLIIDDLGTEPTYNNVTNEYLLAVLSERNQTNLPFIVTTNLSQPQLLDRYGDRIASRLTDKRNGYFIEINGEDLRHKKTIE